MDYRFWIDFSVEEMSLKGSRETVIIEEGGNSGYVEKKGNKHREEINSKHNVNKR